MDGSRGGADTTGTLIDRAELRRLARPLPPMGVQPALDGVRAVSVILVMLYHAGFAALHGGFFGVEVFFVVSGYLITSLLWEERSRQGRVSLGRFWHRRVRRLMPAFLLMVLVITAWAVVFDDAQLEGLRRDLVPALGYVGNWGQIFGKVPYFSTADPLLRHVWSLAVEEQWYLLWPLAFVGLMRITRSRTRLLGGLLAGAAVAIVLWSAYVASSSEGTISVFGQLPDRFNFLYLNTLTRSSGLLLGAALAMLWRPWTRRSLVPGHDVPEHDVHERGVPAAAPGSGSAGVIADVTGFAAMAGIVVIACTRSAAILAEASLYHVWLPTVTVLSAVVVAAAVHPDARAMRWLFGTRPLVAIGQRSYGLYLWRWPVFVFAGVRSDHRLFLPAMLITVGVAELSFRLVETPIRQGAIGRCWSSMASNPGRRQGIVAMGSLAALAAVSVLAVRVVQFQAVDPSVDTSEVAFELPLAAATAAAATTTAAPGDAADTAGTAAPDAVAAGSASDASAVATGVAITTLPATTLPATTLPATTVTLPTLPRRVAIVGDSQAYALSVNQPTGLDTTFTITNGSVDGCGVWDTGSVRTTRPGFRRNFENCVGWQQQWADAVTEGDAEVALVVLGAWDVFDVDVGGSIVAFGTPESDQLFRQHLQSGIDAVVAAGAKVALLEVPCMRPVDVKGAGVPALPERGDDVRVAHVNELLRSVASANPDVVTFVAGPTQWCNDPAIATDLYYRWDGVHPYKPGVKLVFETIGPALLTIPV